MLTILALVMEGNNLGYYLASRKEVFVQSQHRRAPGGIQNGLITIMGGIMGVAMTGLPRITRETNSTHAQELLRTARMSDVCRRCGGMLVEEHCMDFDIGIIGKGYWAKRCIQCGDMIDETILRNRYSPHETLQENENGQTAGIVQACVASPSHDKRGGGRRDAEASHAASPVRSFQSLRSVTAIR